MCKRSLYFFVMCLLGLLPVNSFSQTLTELEYWFDNNSNDIRSITLSGSEDEIDQRIDVSTLSPGVHSLFYRVRQTGGKYPYSPVSSCKFFKFNMGGSKRIEYWFDEDNKQDNRYRLAGKTVGDDEDAITYNEYLNLNHLSPGYHRLYYRALNTDNHTYSSVSMTPIIVNSLYDKVTPENAKMTQLSIGVDDENSTTIHLPETDHTVTINHRFDFRDLGPGSHQLKMKFMNSIGAGISDVSTFAVEAPEEPAITLTAEAKDGEVKLQYNTIPNDIGSRIYRIVDNGVDNAIKNYPVGNYPLAITYIDTPPVGNIRYFVKSNYLDFAGNRHPVVSNEVTVNVADVQPVEVKTTRYAKISGLIFVGGERSWGIKKVTISDGVNEDMTIRSDYYGNFLQGNIPVGAKVTVKVEDDEGHSFPAVTINPVKSGVNDISITGEETGEYKVVRISQPLQFSSYVEILPGQHYRFKVKNISRQSWQGRISVRAMRKEYVDNQPSTDITSPTNSSVFAGNVAPFAGIEYFNEATSDEMIIPAGGESDEIYIPEERFVWKEKQDYYIYFEGWPKDGGGAELIALNPEYNLEKNPLTYHIGESSSTKAANQVFEEDVQFATNLIMHLCSGVKEFDGVFGKYSQYMEYIKEFTEAGLEYIDYDYLAKRIEHAQSYDELFYDDKLWKFKTILYNDANDAQKVFNQVRCDISDLVRHSDNILKFLKDVKTCMNVVKAYNEWQEADDFQKVMTVAENILNYTNNPFSKILKMYLDVTKKTIANARILGEKAHEGYGWAQFMDNNRGSYTDRNQYIDYFIRVKKDTWITSWFSGEEVFDQLYDVTVTAANSEPNGTVNKAKAFFSIKKCDDRVFLRQMNTDGQLTAKPIEDMWMEVRWKNGRIVRVPLRNCSEVTGNGVDFSGTDTPNRYTVTFESETDEAEHMADIIHLDD